ncbi:beta-propeller fold lactonase family protein [Muricauda sp. 2012CJ35-5]|uniref:Beta-propeller fold lactonase family protein n=1 Tax=Flagellimonas spongiicola TaxID=2942208 RepID=A0ABT0PR21_9FLAO|nr:beta-propeller fold lactonase family protein [Allomuricauda spongiicola]MCL6273843.1 beta-propeller fold lactonase family protein [Allomuricauda spongiicola]
MIYYKMIILCVLTAWLSNFGLAQESYQQDFGPRLSPNGKSVVYYSYRNEQLPDIYLMDLDSRTELQITASTSSWDLNPTWSSDGSYIYFSSNRDGEMSIFRIKPDGSSLEKVTKPKKGFRHSEISFSADGKFMLYAEFRPDKKTALILRNTASNEVQVVLESKKSGDEFYKPALHPNGNEIVFLKNMAKDSTYIFDLFSLDVSTKKITNLTNSPNSSERMPNWSQDGAYLLYSNNAGGHTFDLHKRNHKTGKTKQVSFFADRQELNASLGHSKLVYDAGNYGMETDGNTFIFMADEHGKNIEQLTH